MTRWIWLATLGVLLTITCAGKCALVEMEFSGKVDLVADSAYLRGELPIEGIVDVGDLFRGILCYDTSAEDQRPENYSGYYNYDTTPNGISIEINDYVFKTDPESVDLGITIVHGGPIVEPYDAWTAYSLNNLPILETVIIDSIHLSFGADYGKLDDDALLTTEDQLTGWNHESLWISGTGTDGKVLYFEGEITSISLIPEPATIGLLAIGGLMVFIRRKV